MPARKMLKSRNAISPILATLLLIVIAVAAIVVTYAWVMTYMSSTTHQAEVILSNANVRFYTQNSTKKIDFDVENSGTADTKIAAIYVGASPGSMQPQAPTQQLPIPLNAKQIATVTMNYDWTAGATYYFKVISESGQKLGDPDPIPYQAPQS